MGAASSTYSYGIENGLQNYHNIKAMIAVQPLVYPDFVKAMGIPGFVAKRVNKETTKRLGFDLEHKTFLDNVRDITVPTMVMQNKNDPWANSDFVQQYFDGLKGEKEMVWLDLKKSRAAAYDYIGRESKEVLRFFMKYV